MHRKAASSHAFGAARHWRFAGGAFTICAYLGLFPSLPTPPLCHLLLSVRVCTGSVLPPSTHGRFLMDPTPWTATQKPMQVVPARLETGLRPAALHLLPQCIQA